MGAVGPLLVYNYHGPVLGSGTTTVVCINWLYTSIQASFLLCFQFQGECENPCDSWESSFNIGFKYSYWNFQKVNELIHYLVIYWIVTLEGLKQSTSEQWSQYLGQITHQSLVLSVTDQVSKSNLSRSSHLIPGPTFHAIRQDNKSFKW